MACVPSKRCLSENMYLTGFISVDPSLWAAPTRSLLNLDKYSIIDFFAICAGRYKKWMYCGHVTYFSLSIAIKLSSCFPFKMIHMVWASIRAAKSCDDIKAVFWRRCKAHIVTDTSCFRDKPTAIEFMRDLQSRDLKWKSVFVLIFYSMPMKWFR